MESIRKNSTSILFGFETLTIIIFMIEYGLRLWSCMEKVKYAKMGPVLGRIAHSLTVSSIIDLISIVPFWINLIIALREGDFTRFYSIKALAIVRMFRIFRVFTAEKYISSFEVIKEIFKDKLSVLLVALFLGASLFFITSTALYFAQTSVDPELTSIPSCFFPTILLLTGHGYNHPLTLAGKWVVAISNIISVGVFALPTAILSSGLTPAGKVIRNQIKKRLYKRKTLLKKIKNQRESQDIENLDLESQDEPAQTI